MTAPTSTLLDRACDLTLRTYLEAPNAQALLVAAFGHAAVLAAADAAEGSSVAVVVVDGAWYGLWFAPGESSVDTWDSPTGRTVLALDALEAPHAGPAHGPLDLLEALLTNALHQTWVEMWPSGHLLRLLLGAVDPTLSEQLGIHLALVAPAQCDALTRQARVFTGR